MLKRQLGLVSNLDNELDEERDRLVKMIPAEVKRIREAAGMTQADLAKYLRVGHTYISRIENGHSIPSLDLLKSIIKLEKGESQ